MDDTALSIGELARLTGLSAHTLRYYEAEGILKAIGRAANGHRRYRRDDVLWLEFVLRLKRTSMPLAEIKAYAALRTDGDGTMPERLVLLEQHRTRLAEQMAELTRNAAALDDKIALYRERIAAPTPHKPKRKEKS